MQSQELSGADLITFAMSLPPATSSYDAYQIPALEPPPGVVPNFIDPYTRGPMLLALSAVAIGIMYLFVIFRFYVKFYVQRKLTWDDCESTENSWIHTRQSIC